MFHLIFSASKIGLLPCMIFIDYKKRSHAEQPQNWYMSNLVLRHSQMAGWDTWDNPYPGVFIWWPRTKLLSVLFQFTLVKDLNGHDIIPPAICWSNVLCQIYCKVQHPQFTRNMANYSSAALYCNYFRPVDKVTVSGLTFLL